VRRKKAVDTARSPSVNSETLCSGLNDSELSLLETILELVRVVITFSLRVVKTLSSKQNRQITLSQNPERALFGVKFGEPPTSGGSLVCVAPHQFPGLLATPKLL
jgi:hypothetical protein